MFAANSSQKADDKLYVDDVFSTYLYTGNGSTQTINNGIDLAGKGGVVWVKSRSDNAHHAIFSSSHGRLFPNLNNSQDGSPIVSYMSTGLEFNGSFAGYTSFTHANTSGTNYTSWTFRKAPKFFDVVTWTGDGASSRDIPHSLGAVPYFVIVKSTSGIGYWVVGAYDVGGSTNGFKLTLNSTSAHSSDAYASTLVDGYVQQASCTSTTIRVNGGGSGSGVSAVNASGVTYVAYLFAHDTSADGLVQCGSFTADASGNATVNTIGWEPQFAMIKASSTTGDWIMLDSMRGWNLMANGDGKLAANLNAAETYGEYGNPTATGFEFKGGVANATYVYMVIRRPNKPPTSGTQVYNAIARTGTGAAATVTGVGFATDSVWIKARNLTTENHTTYDRLRGNDRVLYKNTTAAESSFADRLCKFDVTMDGARIGTNTDQNVSPNTYINHFFRRAPGFMDVVCYTGDGSNSTAYSHNLASIPEMIIIKSRDQAESWPVYHSATGTGKAFFLNLTNALSTSANYYPATPTALVFTPGLGNSLNTNRASHTYVTYLFASIPGVSKIGSYTGNGAMSQAIDCGFTTGARFVMIKAASTTGDWLVWDTTRGLGGAYDPALKLNTTEAEDSYVDSLASWVNGFQVMNTGKPINTSGVTYIYLAIA